MAFTISANDDGSSDGTFFGQPTVGLCFTPTESIAVTSYEVRWGTSGLTELGKFVHLATAADPTTPMGSAEPFNFDPTKANTWEVITLDAPVTLHAGTEYVIAMDTSIGIAFKAVGTSTFVGLTATRFLKDNNWSGSQSGTTGGFRLHGTVPSGWGVGQVRMGVN